jgi:multidrug/hemolysin transport system permease protein
MMAAPMDQVFAGAPASQVESFEVSMGVVFQFGDQLTRPVFSIIVLVATTAVFFALATLNLSRKRR